MTSANDYQVGGSHYNTKDPAFKHWDWVIATGLGYLEGVATKYVARWRHSKTGLQDLEKAYHYVQKLIEVSPLLLGPDDIELQECDLDTRKQLDAANNRFFDAAALSDQEADFCELLVYWRSVGITNLHGAQEILRAIMEQADKANPVPLSDSNKHAERA